ncbi:alpha/beta fold hydrolase [Bacillus horti]|uniref:Pimeloyl-ACP methyl ester carboxylesterase n=1 Tax=Caldalkalibacillus horti TaxID=77523 RepID=A0ABT9W0L6_9BACI|nr:alpha/beta hydrolase [Bacillus horti]MDQ0166808.1 pimeloyl-ACP methyl ester carboxylesterase [Bacillus horti]
MYVLIGIGFFIAILVIYNLHQFKRAEEQYPPQGKFITINGYRLHYLEQGKEDGQAVVFLHGGVLTANDFQDVMSKAVAHGYRAYAFDRPGYGYSDRPKNTTPEDQAKMIHEALAKLGVIKPILVGHSWSGLLVLAYALQYPGKVTGIITLGGGMYAEGYPAENGDPISSLVITPWLGFISLHTLLATIGPLLSDQIMKVTFNPELVPEGYKQEAKALWLRPGQFRANREDILYFSSVAKRISKKYKDITVPIVIGLGEDDPFETKEHSFRLHREVPQSHLLVWKETAHMIPQLHPEKVWEAIKLL